MANGHGGYRQPANPAPVSGPGALSRRTDGGPGQPVRELPDARYGEAQAFREAQQAAPLAGAEGTPQRAPIDTSGIVGLGEPTQHPDMPVTQGGVDPTGPQAPSENDILRFGSYFKVMKVLASRPEASEATKQLVRQLEAHMNQ